MALDTAVPDPDMPDDSEFEGIDSGKMQRMEDIEAFALIIKDKRKDAIEGRRSSGIETDWEEDDDHYEGVDKYNKKSGITKPRTTDGSFTHERKKVVGRSTAFANITRPYVDAGAARVADMLLPTDDRNWAILPTPVPDLVKSKNNMNPAVGLDGQPIMKAAAPVAPTAPVTAPQQPGMMSRIGGAIAGAFGQSAQPAQPAPQPVTQPVTIGELAQQTIAKAKSSADQAQDTIDNWLLECQYHAEVRKVIECCARLGVGILKGPHPTKKKQRAVTKVEGKWQMQMETTVKPASVCVDPWNFYPDPNCGERVGKGSYVLERDDITARGLMDLKGTIGTDGKPQYIDEMIDLCLEEGPISSIDGKNKLGGTEKLSDKDLFEIWYFHGQVSKKDMIAAGCECENDEAPCVVTMVNDRIIKITMSPLDSGEFPYDVMIWQRKIGHWAGIGIARQMRTCQKGLNGGVRAMQDNAGISSGPQIIVDSSKIEPADGKWAIVPNKLWRKKFDAEDIGDVRDAFTVISIETRQEELLNIINYWTKAAEDITGLPMLLQGQSGKAPETLGGMQMVNGNASSVLRRIARTFDDRVTEPHIGRYYEWLLLHGPDEAKGDFQVDARGSSALVERDVQNQAMMTLLGESLNPAYSLDPEKVMHEVLKGMRLDPKSFVLSDEQKQAKAQQQPPEDPRVTAAKIMASTALQKDATDNKTKEDQILANGQMQVHQQAFTGQQNDMQRQNAIAIQMITEKMQSAALSSDEQQVLAKLKTELTSKNMALSVETNLAQASLAVDVHKHQTPPVMAPPVQVPGRAPNGHAFEQV